MAHLQEARSQIEAIEAGAKGTLAQAEVDAVNRLKATRREIDKKSQELRTAGEANASQIKAEIEADIAKYNALAGQFGWMLKSVSK